MGRKASTPARTRRDVPAEIKWSVLLVDGTLNVVGFLARDISLADACRRQGNYNDRPVTPGTVATVAPSDHLQAAINQTDWTMGKHRHDLDSFTKNQIAHRLYRIQNAEPHVQTLADVGAIARSLEDLAKGLRGHDEFLKGYDSLEASPKVLQNLGYENS